MKILVILEKKEDIYSFLDNQDKDQEYIIIATSPEVCWELEKKAIEYNPINCYWENKQLIDLGMKNFHQVEKLCREIDCIILKGDNIFSKFSISPAMNNYFDIKKTYDAFSLRIIIINSLIKKETPDQIITFSSESWNLPADLNDFTPFDPGINLYSYILKNCNFQFPCKITDFKKLFSEEKPISPSNKIISRVGSVISNFSGLFIYFSVLKNYGISGSFSFLKRSLINSVRGGRRLLIVGFSYNWNHIMSEIYARGYSLYYFKVKNSCHNHIENIAIPKDVFRDYCTTEDVSFSEPFMAIILNSLNKHICFTSSIVSNFKDVLQKKKIKAVLFGVKSTYYDNLLAQTARDCNVPVISWQHGAQGINYAPMMLYVEVMNSSVHLCYGSGVLDTFKEDLEKFPVKLIPVGSYELTEIQSKSNIKREIKYDFLYVTTNYYANELYVSSPSVLDDIGLWHTQRSILDILGSSSVTVSFKLHPGKYQYQHLREYIEHNKYHNITTFKTEENYVDLLYKSDIVIIDFPSTTLLQAIAAKKVVFVLLQHLKITESAKNLLCRRAYCSETIEEFVELIWRYINNEPIDQSPDINNTEFLEHYGIYNMDADVANRAIAVIDTD